MIAVERMLKFRDPLESFEPMSNISNNPRIFRRFGESEAQRVSPFAPRKSVNEAHFRGANGDNCVWHAQSEALAWELWHIFLATHHALRKLRDVPHDAGRLENNFTA